MPLMHDQRSKIGDCEETADLSRGHYLSPHSYCSKGIVSALVQQLLLKKALSQPHSAHHVKTNWALHLQKQEVSSKTVEPELLNQDC